MVVFRFVDWASLLFIEDDRVWMHPSKLLKKLVNSPEQLVCTRMYG